MSEQERMSVRKSYRRFHSYDLWLKRVSNRVERVFITKEALTFLAELFEPTISGLAFGLGLWALDRLREGFKAPLLFSSAVDSAVEHARPDALLLALLLLGFYLLIVGSFLSSLVRRITVLPLSRLSAHASMFVLGVLWALPLKEAATTDHKVLGQTVQVTLALVVLGAFARMIVRAFESPLFDRLGQRYQSARLLCSAVGVSIIVLRGAGILDVTKKDAERAAAAHSNARKSEPLPEKPSTPESAPSQE